MARWAAAPLGLLVLLGVLPPSFVAHAGRGRGTAPVRAAGSAPPSAVLFRATAARCAPPLRLAGGAGGERTREATTRARRKTQDMEVDVDHELETAVKRRAQERRAGEGTALVFPSQAAVRQKDEVEADFLGKSVKYHCHSQKVVKERSAEEKAEREEQRSRRAGRHGESLRLPPGSVPGDATDGLRLQGVRKHSHAVQKKSSINCTLAIQHGLFNATELGDYLRSRIKFNNKLHNLDSAISIEVDGDDVVVSAYRATQMKRKRKWEKKMVLADAFSTRYLRYLMKKFIVQKELKDFVRPVSVDFSKASQEKGASGVRFEIRYTSIHKNKFLRLKMAQKHGTRLERARRELVNKVWEEHDGQKLQVPRVEMLMERKIKATGERVGGSEWLNRTRLTLAEATAQSKELLKHWVELQKQTYRAPFGGAMRGWQDRSITRHDPDRVGKRSHGTAGYTASAALRSRTGTRLGIENLLYTGTAPDGVKGVRKRAVSQRLADRAQKTLYRVSKSYSRQGDADRTIYNWKPKWLLAGKMDLHKRDWR